MDKSKFDIELPQEIIDALARHVISEIRSQRILEESQSEKKMESKKYSTNGGVSHG